MYNIRSIKIGTFSHMILVVLVDTLSYIIQLVFDSDQVVNGVYALDAILLADSGRTRAHS
jgi:hypothetical protein